MGIKKTAKKGPDFICIGAHKGGTSWLYENLCKHPDFSLLPVKELHYFDRSKKYASPGRVFAEGNFGGRFFNPMFYARIAKRMRRAVFQHRKPDEAIWWARQMFSSYSDSWYLSLFDSMKGITGDVTPAYSFLKREDVKHVHSVCPDARILFILRDPVKRAWSHYRYSHKKKKIPDLDDFQKFRSFVDSPRQKMFSNYLGVIDLFLDYYDPKNFRILFYDAILRDPQGLIDEVASFMGARKVRIKGLRKMVNKSKPVQMPGKFHEYLREEYRSDIRELARRYGGYARKWELSLDGGGEADQVEGKPCLPMVCA